MACVAFDVAGGAIWQFWNAINRQSGVAFGVAGLAFARSRETREAGEWEGLAHFGAFQTSLSYKFTCKLPKWTYNHVICTYNWAMSNLSHV